VIRALVKRIEIDHDKIAVVFRVPGSSPQGETPLNQPPPTWGHRIGNIVGTSIDAS
jgi:hypothetical protein